MELDLTEYDQVEEIRSIIENHDKIYGEGSASKFLVTLSSCSDQASLEDTNCENDFVFLPAPNKLTVHSNQQPSQQSLINVAPSRSQGNLVVSKLETRSHYCSGDTGMIQINNQTSARPLISITTNGNNPFGNSPKDPLRDGFAQPQSNSLREFNTVTCTSKPVGLLEVYPAVANSPNKLAELMQQIVTRSDMIYIAIPCAYCHEPVACPPSDISNWLNHMCKLHNCKVCPVCNKMIGLGARRDIEIMKQHVIEHLDDDWLERRALKVSFSFGLQQQWFSGNRCSVKDSRNR